MIQYAYKFALRSVPFRVPHASCDVKDCGWTAPQYESYKAELDQKMNQMLDPLSKLYSTPTVTDEKL